MRTTLTLFDLAFLAQGATPVAGVTPASFNPARWYDANSFSGDLADDALISPAFPWDDQSANDDDAASTNTHEPTFHTNEINGKPIVRFTAGQRMRFEGGDISLSDFTILCVALSGADSIFLSRDGGNTQIRTNRINQARASWFGGTSGEELISNQFLSNLSQPRLIGYRRFGNPGPQRTFRFFDNLTEVMPTTGNVDTVPSLLNQIGIIDGGPLSIDIAELVIYDTALTTDEIRALYNEYFKPKFALP